MMCALDYIDMHSAGSSQDTYLADDLRNHSCVENLADISECCSVAKAKDGFLAKYKEQPKHFIKDVYIVYTYQKQ